METRSFEDRVAGNVITQRRFVLKSGQTCVANQVLALEVSSGKLVNWNSDDGSLTAYIPKFIAKDACDASLADKHLDYYFNVDQFNANKLVFEKVGDVWTTIAEIMRSHGINLVEFQPSDAAAQA